MLALIVKKMGALIATLLAITLIATSLVCFLPEEVIAWWGRDLRDVEDVEDIIKDLGLDRPALSRYAYWLARIFKGDFGYSYRSNNTVLDRIFSRMPVTVTLILLSLLVSLGVSFLTGAFPAYSQRSLRDPAGSLSILLKLSMFSYKLIAIYSSIGLHSF